MKTNKYLSVMGAVGAMFLATTGAAHAQTKMQCQIDHTGVVTAPLIWQNTLGVEKANSICRSYVSAPSQAPTAEQMAGEAAMRQFIAHHQGAQVAQRSGAHQTQQRFSPDLYARATADQPKEWVISESPRQQMMTKTPPSPPTAQRGVKTDESQYVPLELSGAQHKDDGYVSMW